MEFLYKAIAIFEDRIEGRFLKPIKLIEDYPYSGFATMALDCLLIETLQQFIEGKAETPRNKSGEYFKLFLTQTSFKRWFDENMASMFFDQIRCGILHQAETKQNSLIKTGKTIPLARLTEDGFGLVVNRRLFHNQLESELEAYSNKLRMSTNKTLRNNFKKKMDHICRVNQ